MSSCAGTHRKRAASWTKLGSIRLLMVLQSSPLKPPSITSITFFWISPHLNMLSLYRHCDGSGLKLENASILARAGIQCSCPQAFHSLKLARHLEGTSGLMQSLVIAGFVFDNKIYLKKQNLNILLFIANFLSPEHLPSASGQEVKRQQQKKSHFPFLSPCSAALYVSVSVCERLQILPAVGNVRPKSASGREALLLAGTKWAAPWLADCCYGSSRTCHCHLWLVGTKTRSSTILNEENVVVI